MNTLGFMALDVRSVRPYTLPLIGAAVLGVAVGQLGSTGYPTATLSIAAVIVTMLVSSYLFSLDERSGLDTLYGLARLTRAQVVIGRYATLLTAALVSTLLGVLAYPLAAWRAGVDAWAGLPEAALGVWCGVGWMIAVQAPVCFRSGYTKARFILLVLALAMFCAVMGGASILQFSVATQSGLPGWGLPALVLATAAALVASGALSIRWYRRRDL